MMATASLFFFMDIMAAKHLAHEKKDTNNMI